MIAVILPDTQNSYVKDCDIAANEPVAITTKRDKSSDCSVIATTLNNIHFLHNLNIACAICFEKQLNYLIKSSRSSA